MEEYKSNSAQNLGIAALITGIITFILAVIPCVGIIAIIPGIITIVLASVGLSQASRNNSPKGLQIAGLVIGIFAVFISFSQIFVGARLARNSGRWPEEIRKAVEDVKTDIMNDLEDNNVNIRIESDGDTIEIKARTKINDEKVKQLEDLESGGVEKNDTVRKSK
jgi:membrane-bound ClpP family serine protease